MHFVDARELQERVQQQIRGHLGVLDLDLRAQMVLLQTEGGSVECRSVVFGAAGVGMNGLGMVDVKILGDVVAAVGHKL
jgi:hypothetical protein